ncbi:zinc knuckle, partial [Ostertagia ostertagi]
YTNTLTTLTTTNSNLEATSTSTRVLEEALAALGASSKMVLEALIQFTETLDHSETPPTHEQETKYQEYLENVEGSLEEAQALIIRSFTTQKILGKFQVELQRKVLKQFCDKNASDDDWNVHEMVVELDKIMTAEERLLEMLPDKDRHIRQGNKPTGGSRSESAQVRNAPTQPRKCLYCDSTDHNSLRCSKVVLINDRSELLRRNRRCTNCGMQNHFVRECASTGCRRCDNKKHHFSICPKLVQEVFGRQEGGENTRQPPPTRGSGEKTGKPYRKVNTQSIESTSNPQNEQNPQFEETCSAEVQSMAEGDRCGKNDVYLLTGTAWIRHPSTNQVEEVHILLDTGADKSFIQSEFAN